MEPCGTLFETIVLNHLWPLNKDGSRIIHESSIMKQHVYRKISINVVFEKYILFILFFCIKFSTRFFVNSYQTQCYTLEESATLFKLKKKKKTNENKTKQLNSAYSMYYSRNYCNGIIKLKKFQQY